MHRSFPGTLLLKFNLCFFAALWVNTLASQPYYFNHYQVEDGLSNNTVFCSIQDKLGFIWFGTRDGLNRFDGYTFKIFSNLNDENILESNFIRALKEDTHGTIWVGTDQGLFIFDPLKENFHLFQEDITGEILDIQIDRAGRVWFISDLVLYRFSPASGSLKRISGDFLVSAFLLPKEGNLTWVATANGQMLLYGNDDEIKGTYSVFEKSSSSIDKWIETLSETQVGELLVGTRKQGIKLFNSEKKEYRDLLKHDFKNETIFVRDIVWVKDDEYWFATESGIIIYKLETNQHRYLTKENNNPWALSDNAVYTLLKDSEGAIWAGTYFGGINYYSPRNGLFEKFYPLNGQNSISGYAVREIVNDNSGNLWIGTEDNGLNKFDLKENVFTNFHPSPNSGSIAFSNIHGLLVTGDTLWIGTFEHGLDMMNVNTGKVFRHFYADGKTGSLANNFIFNILKTRKGEILLATGRGIYKYLSSSSTFENYSGFPGYIFYTNLFEDNRGTIWAGTWRDGLLFYNPGTKKSGRLIHVANDTNSLLSNRINRVFQDRSDNIWVATEGGLSQLKKGQYKFRHFTMQNGLPSNLILAMLEDNNGVLWITTTRGLVRYNQTTGSMKTFTRVNGLLSDQFNYNSAYKDKNGRMYFGSVRGMIRFNPDRYSDPNYNSTVYITGLQIQNNEVKSGEKDSPLKNSVIFTKDIKLSYKQSTFSIDFAALSFGAADLTEYAYKMEGLDRNWNHLKSNRKVYFTNLSPGHYIFRVNVLGASGKLTGKEAKLDIVITPPFWASTEAWIVYVILCGIIIFIILRGYDQRIKSRNRIRIENIKHQREKSLYQAKIDFFTDVVHEIKTPLTLIKAPLEKLLMVKYPNPDVNKNLKLINKNSDRLLTLSNQLLDFRKAESEGFRVTFNEINISKLVKDVFRNFQLLKKDNIELSLNLPQEPVFAETDEEAFRKIITNLLDNSLKYCDTFVKVDILKDTENNAGVIRILIANDGRTIPPNLQEKIFEPFYRVKNEIYRQGTGLGLALARSLSQMLYGTLILKFSENDLTTFQLTIPRKHSKDIKPA